MPEAEAPREDVAEPDRQSVFVRALPWVLAIGAILALGYWWGAASRPGMRTTGDWWTDLPDSGMVIENDSEEPVALRMVFEGGEIFATSLEPHEEVVTDIGLEPETWLRVELSRDPSMLTDAGEVPPFRGDYFLPRSLDECYLLRVGICLDECPLLSVAGAVREELGQRSRRVQRFGYPRSGVRVDSNASDSRLKDVRFELGEAEVDVGELPPESRYVWCPARSELEIQEATIWYTLNGQTEERWAYPDGGPGLACNLPPIWEFSIPHW